MDWRVSLDYKQNLHQADGHCQQSYPGWHIYGSPFKRCYFFFLAWAGGSGGCSDPPFVTTAQQLQNRVIPPQKEIVNVLHNNKISRSYFTQEQDVLRGTDHLAFLSSCSDLSGWKLIVKNCRSTLKYQVSRCWMRSRGQYVWINVNVMLPMEKTPISSELFSLRRNTTEQG